jgi:hypothetical protein
MSGAARAPFSRWLVVVGLLSVIGLAAAGASYWSYKSEWLRDPPKLSACARLADRKLSKPEPHSGYEAHGIPNGGTVYLRPSEDGAVRCMNMMSREVAEYLAEAYAIHDELERAQALSAVANRVAEQHASDERLTFSTYLLTAPAMVGEAPPVKALKAELDERYACRYDIGGSCPRRPPTPKLVYAFGVPSAAGLLVVLGVLATAGAGRVRRWHRERRAGKAAGKPETAEKSPERSRKERKKG